MGLLSDRARHGVRLGQRCVVSARYAAPDGGRLAKDHLPATGKASRQVWVARRGPPVVSSSVLSHRKHGIGWVARLGLLVGLNVLLAAQRPRPAKPRAHGPLVAHHAPDHAGGWRAAELRCEVTLLLLRVTAGSLGRGTERRL